MVAAVIGSDARATAAHTRKLHGPLSAGAEPEPEPEPEQEEETAAVADEPAAATPRRSIAASQSTKPDPAPQANGSLSSAAAQPKDSRAAEIDEVRDAVVLMRML